MTQFKAIRIDKDPYRAAYADFDETELMEGDVTVRVSHSTVNYKDGLALTGKSPVVRGFPLIARHRLRRRGRKLPPSRVQARRRVVLNGWGVGETHHGGYRQKARVKGDWLVHAARRHYRRAEAWPSAPPAIPPCSRVHGAGAAGRDAGPRAGSGHRRGGRGRLDRHRAARQGGLARDRLHRPGRTKPTILKALGASEIIDRAELSAPGRPLGKERWAAAVDCVGWHTLANVLAQTAMAAPSPPAASRRAWTCRQRRAVHPARRNACSASTAVNAPKPMRLQAWDRLARELDRTKLAELSTTIGFYKVMDTAAEILQGKVRGRVIVEID